MKRDFTRGRVINTRIKLFSDSVRFIVKKDSPSFLNKAIYLFVHILNLGGLRTLTPQRQNVKVLFLCFESKVAPYLSNN